MASSPRRKPRPKPVLVRGEFGTPHDVVDALLQTQALAEEDKLRAVLIVRVYRADDTLDFDTVAGGYDIVPDQLFRATDAGLAYLRELIDGDD
jgi:hypothetical protein